MTTAARIAPGDWADAVGRPLRPMSQDDLLVSAQGCGLAECGRFRFRQAAPIGGGPAANSWPDAHFFPDLRHEARLYAAPRADLCPP